MNKFLIAKTGEFEWGPKLITINVGDSITWIWKKNSALSQLLYTVFQVSGPTETEYDGNGFHAGNPTSSGK